MKTVKVVNLKKYVESQLGKALEVHGVEVRDEDVAVLVKDKTVVVADTDAVHDIYTAEGEIVIDLYAKDKISADGSRIIAMAPIKVVKIPVPELLEVTGNPDFTRDSSLTEFVRHFGSRIESNYSVLLRSIRQIGLDPEDYPR